MSREQENENRGMPGASHLPRPTYTTSLAVGRKESYKEYKKIKKN